MKRAPLFAGLLLAAACGAPRRTSAGASSLPAVPPVPAERRAPAEPPEVKDPNFILVVNESVPNPDDDGVSYTKIFVDGKEAGKTAVGRKSEERELKLKLPPGNVLIRLEQWILPGVGEWTRLDDSLQPRERFVRIEPGTIARLELRFSDGESYNTLTLSRQAAPN
ncbi:MAG TPA: hypothetical protein VN915_03805 [Elusimicrobiota bacterium]|nr:hypothetical protein [Elusimicrobiota bacterium]